MLLGINDQNRGLTVDPKQSSCEKNILGLTEVLLSEKFISYPGLP